MKSITIRQYVFGVLVLIVLAIIAYAAMMLRDHLPVPAPLAAAPVAMKSYANSMFGYSLQYPAALSLQEYPNGDAVLGTQAGDVMNGVAEVHALDVDSQPGEQAFDDSLGEQLMNLCAADGPSESISCTGAEQVAPFTTTAGVSGLSLYLDGEIKNLATNATTSIQKGPFYVIPAEPTTTGTRVFVVAAPMNLVASESDPATIQAIAASFVLPVGIPTMEGQS